MSRVLTAGCMTRVDGVDGDKSIQHSLGSKDLAIRQLLVVHHPPWEAFLRTTPPQRARSVDKGFSQNGWETIAMRRAYGDVLLRPSLATLPRPGGTCELEYIYSSGSDMVARELGSSGCSDSSQVYPATRTRSDGAGTFGGEIDSKLCLKP